MINSKDIKYTQDTIQWLVSRDTLAIIHFGPNELFEVRKGKGFFDTTSRSYQNEWPAHTIPKRWLYIYATLRRYYERYHEVHPNNDCEGPGFCPICSYRQQDLTWIAALVQYMFHQGSISPLFVMGTGTVINGTHSQ